MCRSLKGGRFVHIGATHGLKWPMDVVRMEGRLNMRLTDGTTWIRPAGSLLLLPRSEQDILSALQRQATAGSFISACYRQERELISILETVPQSTSASWSGEIGSIDTVTFHPEEEANDFFFY